MGFANFPAFTLWLHKNYPCKQKFTRNYFLGDCNNASRTKVYTGDFAPPKPEFRAEFWEQILDARISDANSWVEFYGSVVSSKRGPLKN